MSTREKISFSLFVLAAAVLLFWNLGQVPLFEPDEGRYADMSLQMIQTGDFLIPRVNHIVHLHKPPLFNWLVAGSFKLFGPSELSARLPSVLFSLFVLGGAVLLGKFLFGFRAGFYSGWILLTSALYLVTSRLVTIDMTLTFFTLIAMALAANLFFGTRYRVLSFYCLVLSTALGMLAKGPVAWMITLLPLVIFALLFKKRIFIPLRHWLIGSLLFLGLSLSWYLALTIQNPELFSYFLKYQLYGRMAGGTGHAKSFFYFFIVLPLGFLPWSVFLPHVFSWKGTEGKITEVRAKVLFLILWFAVPFILFSLIQTKLATYVVPLFIPLALLVGRFWDRLTRGEVQSSRFLTASSWFLAAVFGIFALGALIFILIKPEFVAGIPHLYIFLAAAVLFAASALEAWALRKGSWLYFFRIQTGSIFIIALLAFTALPQIQFKNAKRVAEEIEKIRRPGDIILMYDHYFASLPFYLRERILTVGVPVETELDPARLMGLYVFWNDDDIRNFWAKEERVLAVMQGKSFEKAKSFSSKPLHVLFRHGKLLLVSNQP